VVSLKLLPMTKKVYFFEPGNIQDLTSKIIWTRQNYQEMIYLATHGQNKVRQLFNLDKTISEFSKVFSHEVSK